MHSSAQSALQATLRAKKTVACLLWITSKPLTEIEAILTQFGGAFDGAAGAIRSVRSRTCDLLTTTARVAEILYPGLDLGSRMSRLLARLEIGVPSELAELAMSAGTVLSRGDYLQLLRAGLASKEAVREAPNEALLRCVRGSEVKVQALRRAVAPEESITPLPGPPILPDYQA
jgi:hypothetical protein